MKLLIDFYSGDTKIRNVEDVFTAETLIEIHTFWRSATLYDDENNVIKKWEREKK